MINSHRNVSIAALALFTTATPAVAGWQWTDWGMTRAQVEKAASAHSVVLSEAKNSRPDQVELNTPYATLGLQFLARLIFNEYGTLIEVVLVQNDVAQCPVLENLVKSSYGVPYDSYAGMGTDTWSWRDEKSKNDVMFRLIGMPGSRRWCDIQYSKLASAHDLGL